MMAPARPCSHSGCTKTAAAALAFDYASRRVWLHDLPNPPDPASYDLCADHSDRFRPPRGWESPGLTETDETIDLLAEAGIEYVADWVLDEQPLPIRTRSGRMFSVPYTVEINERAKP